MSDQVINHRIPKLKTRWAPNMSARRANGRRKAPVTSENTLAGHVFDSVGMFNSVERTGRMELNPLMKYSYLELDPCAQKPFDRYLHQASLKPKVRNKILFLPTCS